MEELVTKKVLAFENQLSSIEKRFEYINKNMSNQTALLENQSNALALNRKETVQTFISHSEEKIKVK